MSPSPLSFAPLRSPPLAARPLLAAAADKGAAAAAGAGAGAASSKPVDPNNPVIAPSYVPWKEYKNEYYRKRGFQLADKDWTVRKKMPFAFSFSRVVCVWTDTRGKTPPFFSLPHPLHPRLLAIVAPALRRRKQIACVGPAASAAGCEATTGGKTRRKIHHKNPFVFPPPLPFFSFFSILQEWSDLPAPYKYLGVKVDPAHVEKPGAVWKFLSDWKVGVPFSMLVAMPLYSSGLFPGFDERLQLGLLIMIAGTVLAKEAGPMFKKWKAEAGKAKVA